tara:strand:- start:9 stop:584 length:576 start_codon:yes stop_codon:yes gene_type:complete
MRDLIICDNFYSNVDEVRAFALQQDFNVDGNYPGHRTKSFLTPEIADYIGQIVGAEVDMEGLGDDTYCGAYQYTTAKDRTWIHADGWNTWAGVLYLTPNAPVTGGTGLFKHKPTGEYKMPRLSDGSRNETLLAQINNDAQDYTKWERVDTVGNKYNRAVFYKGDLFHASLDYFGHDLYDGRLFQTFFFNTK